MPCAVSTTLREAGSSTSHQGCVHDELSRESTESSASGGSQRCLLLLPTNTDHKSGGDEPQRFRESCSSYVATSLFAARVCRSPQPSRGLCTEVSRWTSADGDVLVRVVGYIMLNSPVLVHHIRRMLRIGSSTSGQTPIGTATPAQSRVPVVCTSRFVRPKHLQENLPSDFHGRLECRDAAVKTEAHLALGTNATCERWLHQRADRRSREKGGSDLRGPLQIREPTSSRNRFFQQYS